MNNITIHFTLKNTIIEKYFNKYKCIFNNKHNDVIQTLIDIEKDILMKYNQHKKKHYKLEEQLNKSFFKFFIEHSNNTRERDTEFIIKISGIWETDDVCGIIYKFLKI